MQPLRRVSAESSPDPGTGGDFLPTTGEITYLKEPGGPGVRVDSALYQGMRITADYDSLLAKVIGWGASRATALVRLRRALREFQVGGLATDLGYLLQILESAAFVTGQVNTTFLDTYQPPCPQPTAALDTGIAAAIAYLTYARRRLPRLRQDRPSDGAWRAVAWNEQMVG